MECKNAEKQLLPIKHITEAGSYVDSDGVVYLVDSDMELYLVGELDVYALVSNNLEE